MFKMTNMFKDKKDPRKTKSEVILLSFLLTLNIFPTLMSCFIVDFEQLNHSWVL